MYLPSHRSNRAVAFGFVKLRWRHWPHLLLLDLFLPLLLFTSLHLYHASVMGTEALLLRLR
jgi:hypothetical protein